MTVDNVPANHFPLHLFFEHLSRAGITVSIRDYRRVSRVLVADGEWTLQRLERVLGNLLVHDRDERLLFQHEFRTFFAVPEGESVAVDVQQWRDEIARLLAEMSVEKIPLNPPFAKGEVKAPDPQSPAPPLVKGGLGGISPWQWLVVGVVWAAVLAIIVSVSFVSKLKDPVRPPSTLPATVVKQTDTLNGKPPISDMIKVQVAQQPVEPVQDKRILPELWLPGAVLAALLALGLLGLWWTQYRPPRIRQKIPCDPHLPAQYFDDASVGGAMPPWLAEADADHLADQLSYILTDQFTRELDIPASIRATSEAGSVPVLRFQKRRDLQRILILTDQLVPQQGWHQLPAELVQALQARGVHLTFGRFNRSPERFMDQHGRAQRLEDWEEYRHHLLLLIFADTHQAEGLQDFPWRDWPDARLLTRQEQRDWDFREQNLQAQGVRLLQADAAGIQQAWGEAARRPAALEAARWEVEGQKPEESDAAFLERALGAALPWAQALAYYPGAWSLAAAERLREKLFVDVPRLALQRLLGLPGTWVAAGVAVFESRLQVALREGFLRRTRAEHEAAVGVWLGMMAEETPSPASLAWAIWRWKCIRLAWVLDPDQAAKDLHALVVSVPALGEAIREEVAQLPEDAVSTALLMPATRTGRRHLLALGEVCGLKQAVVYAAAPWLRNAGVVSVLVLVGIGGWNRGETPPSPPLAKGGEREVAVPHMITIPAGKFTMGCVEGRDNVEGVAKCSDNADETPAHEVSISAFEMSVYVVTVGQYTACVDAGACPKPEWDAKDAPSYYAAMGEALKGENYPIVGVSWDNAQAYIKWLNIQTGKNYRLPTEAEWEYAARGGKDTAYPWGDSIGKNNANCDNGQCGDKFDYTSPVGSFAPNPFGLYDMNGNVWQWCQDWYGDYPSSAESDPKGASSGAYRVLRGGSWRNDAQIVRSARRNCITPVNRYYDNGFRLASGQK